MRVAVLGAGLTGLVAALRLAERGHAVDVYERLPWPGGRAGALDLGGGVLLERLPLHWCADDVAVIGLCEELGIVDVDWAPATSAVAVQGRAWPWSTPTELLRLGVLGRRDRLRLRSALRALERLQDATAPVSEWALRELGAAGWEELWGPVLRRRLGPRGGDVALGTVRDLLGGRPLLGRPRGSHAVLTAALVNRVAALSGRVLLDRPAARIGLLADGALRVTPAAPGSYTRGEDPRDYDPYGSAERYDAIIVTTQRDIVLDLLEDPLVTAVGDRHLDALEALELRGVVSLLVEVDRQLQARHRVLVADEALSFTELTEPANLTELGTDRRFAYLTTAIGPDEAPPAADADRLLAAHLPSLRRLVPEFSPAWVADAWVSHEAGALPVVPARGGSVPALRTPVPGLVVATAAQAPSPDGGPDAAVRLGEAAAMAVARDV